MARRTAENRASRTRIGAPLRPLSEFRFSDQLVWGVVVGVTILVLPTLQDVRQHLDGRVARWWYPDAVEVVDSLPRTGVGKYQKHRLREIYRDYFEESAPQ